MPDRAVTLEELRAWQRSRGIKWGWKKTSLPSKREIEERALEIKIAEETARGLPSIRAERGELREGGYLTRAQYELMRAEDTEAKAQQLKYLHELAGETGFVAVPEREYAKLQTRRLTRRDVQQISAHYAKRAKETSADISLNGFRRLFVRNGNGDMEHYLRKIDRLFKPKKKRKPKITVPKPPRVRLPRVQISPPIKPKVPKVIIPKVEVAKVTAKRKRRRKKRDKAAMGRNGATSRRWKPIDGKVYELSDDIWGIKPPRKKGKRKRAKGKKKKGR